MSYIKKYFLPPISIPALINGILLYHNPSLGIFSTVVTITYITHLLRIQNTLSFAHTLLLLCIWTNIGLSTAWYEIHNFETFHREIKKKNIDLVGTVTDYQYCSHMRNSHRITFALSHYTIENKQYPLSGSIFIYINHASLDQLYAVGSTLHIKKVQIKKPEQYFAQYLIKEGVLGTIFTLPETIIQKNSSHTWYSYIHTLRKSIFTRIKEKLSSEHFALFSALFLGNKLYNKTDTEPIQDQFRTWGIAHIFARSGMHISIVVGILISILWFIPIPYQTKITAITSIGIIYTLCSWSSVSFMRSFIMFVLGNYGTIYKRYTSPFYLLTLTAAFILILHPLNLFFLDFQLSFALTGALIWICTNISNQS